MVHHEADCEAAAHGDGDSLRKVLTFAVSTGYPVANNWPAAFS